MKQAQIPIAELRRTTETTRARSSHLRISERDIRQAAREHGPRASVVSICFRHAVVAAKLRWRKILFRRNRNALARAAYCQMKADEFRTLNARQAWANWRTIPRNLAGRLPRRPVFALDLCCGIGDSTGVLAYYCAPGSRLLGYEFNPAFVEAARRRVFYDVSGNYADVQFVVQDILETFRDGSGSPLKNESVDMVNASGAIGCHFDLAATEQVARECARVVKREGLALIDAGQGGVPARDLVALFNRHGFRAIHQARSCVFDRYWQFCLKKIG
jgi:SAM-dependent methyltransferase